MALRLTKWGHGVAGKPLEGSPTAAGVETWENEDTWVHGLVGHNDFGSVVRACLSLRCNSYRIGTLVSTSHQFANAPVHDYR